MASTNRVAADDWLARVWAAAAYLWQRNGAQRETAELRSARADEGVRPYAGSGNTSAQPHLD